MHCVTVLYPNKSDAKFDFDYYLAKHIPMVAGFFGTGIAVQKGVSSLTGPSAPFVCIARISIHSADHFQKTMVQHGVQILNDIPTTPTLNPPCRLMKLCGTPRLVTRSAKGISCAYASFATPR